MRSLALAFALASLGCAAGARERVVDGRPVVEGDVTELRLQGMTILVKRLPHQPVTSCQLFLRGGVRNWTAATAGVEKLALETAVNGGIEGMSKAAFQARLASLGTQLGAESGEDDAVLGFKALDRNFVESFKLMVAAFRFPQLPEAEVALQRQLMLSELRQEEENPDGLLSKLLHAKLYQGLAYAARASGTPETLARLTREDLAHHLAKLRETRRLVLVVVGNVDPAEVAALASRGFGDLPPGNYVESRLPAPEPKAPTAELIDRPLPTHYLIEAFPAPTWGDADMAVGVVAMNALREKLFEEVRTKRELSYAPSAGLSLRGLGEGYLYVTAVELAKTVGVMQEVVRAFQAGRIDPERLEGDKRIFLTSFLMQNETTSGQGDLLAGAEVIGGDWRLARDLPARVRQVDAGQVAAFLSRYLRNLQVVMLGKTEGLSPRMFEGM
jgi:zinc protease